MGHYFVVCRMHFLSKRSTRCTWWSEKRIEAKAKGKNQKAKTRKQKAKTKYQKQKRKAKTKSKSTTQKTKKQITKTKPKTKNQKRKGEKQTAESKRQKVRKPPPKKQKVAFLLTKLFQFHLIWPNKWLMERGSFCEELGTPPLTLAIISCMQSDTHHGTPSDTSRGHLPRFYVCWFCRIQR